MHIGEKCQKAIRIAAVTMAVYLVFRYLLPLLAPFLLACGAAFLLRPSALWLSGKLRVRWRGKSWGVAPGVAGGLELAALMAALGVLLYVGGRKLYQQVYLLSSRFPGWVRQFDVYLTGACRRMEEFFSLKEDVMITLARELILNMMNNVKQGMVPYIMGNSVTIAKCFIGAGVLVLLFTIGVVMFIQEMDRWREKIRTSAFQEEFQRIGRVLGTVGNAYLKTQGLIVLLTMIICAVGLGLLGNPYWILLGIGIGILDALPIFGTGTVLIPWAVISFIRRKWIRGIVVLALYIICYFVRELVETKMMGDKVGLSPLETLIAIYVGLQLFGVMGVFLGPVGVLIVKEFV